MNIHNEKHQKALVNGGVVITAVLLLAMVTTDNIVFLPAAGASALLTGALELTRKRTEFPEDEQ